MQQFDSGDLQQLQFAIEQFAKKYSISKEDILSIAATESIPLDVFNKKHSPLETIVKYLKENAGKRLTEIAKILHKDSAAIWIAYRNANKKDPKKFECSAPAKGIPLSALQSDSLSLLELIVSFLHEKENMGFREIGKLILRNERTVWTAYNRAKQKRGTPNGK